MNQPAQVQEKAPKPPGPSAEERPVLASHRTGIPHGRHHVADRGQEAADADQRRRRPPLRLQAPLEVNETKITELQNRIEELQRQQLVAQSALAQQTRLLGAAPQDSQQAQQQSASGNPPDQRAEDPIQAERKRRAYVSLFASNVALTYRKTPSHVAPAPESEAAPAAPSLVPVRTRRPTGRATLERDATAIQLHRTCSVACAGAKRFRGNNPRSKGGSQKSCRRAGWLRQCGGRKNLRTL